MMKMPLDANSILPFHMWDSFGESGLKYIRNCEFSKYQTASILSLTLAGDDSETPTFLKQHWWGGKTCNGKSLHRQRARTAMV